MRIVWNEPEYCFEAELASGDEWSKDQETAKQAGFKTTGPPAWRWQTRKAAVLIKLKKLIGPVTITPEALKKLKPLVDQEVKNEEVRKAIKDAKSAAKKAAQKEAKRTANDYVLLGVQLTDEKWWIEAADLPKRDEPVNDVPAVPKTQPDGMCASCGCGTWAFEFDESGLCLWCQKQADEVWE